MWLNGPNFCYFQVTLQLEGLVIFSARKNIEVIVGMKVVQTLLNLQ